jgi:hypothetical protein
MARLSGFAASVDVTEAGTASRRRSQESADPCVAMPTLATALLAACSGLTFRTCMTVTPPNVTQNCMLRGPERLGFPAAIDLPLLFPPTLHNAEPT